MPLARRINRGFAPFFGPANLPGRSFYVDGTEGVDAGRTGLNPTRPLLTIGAAIALLDDLDTVYINPGEYDEALVLTAARPNVTFIGLGGPGGVVVKPTTTNATALTNAADNVTLVNVTLTGDGTGAGLSNIGAYFTAVDCCFGNGGAVGVIPTNSAANTGRYMRLLGCRVCGCATGIDIKAYAAANPIRDLHIIECLIYDCPTVGITETPADVDDSFEGLLIKDCVFGHGDPYAEPPTYPTHHITLNDSNHNSGLIVDSCFLTLINGGRVLLSTTLAAIGCSFLGTQPS